MLNKLSCLDFAHIESLEWGLGFYYPEFFSIIGKWSPSFFADFVPARAYSVCAECVTFRWNILGSASSTPGYVFHLVSRHFFAKVRGWTEAFDHVIYRHARI